MAEGVHKRHSKGCSARTGGRCNCNAGYEAWVFSKRDGKKIRRTFLGSQKQKPGGPMLYEHSLAVGCAHPSRQQLAKRGTRGTQEQGPAQSQTDPAIRTSRPLSAHTSRR